MNADAGFDAIEARLRAVAMAADIAPSVRENAEALLARLTSPVRVSLLGLPEAGKSIIVNALLGSQILPDSPDLPTIEVSFGAESRAQITLDDGTVEEHSGPMGPAQLDGAVLVSIECPLTLLRRITLMTVMADATIEDQRAATAWAARRTDIALWCSARYSETDELLWDGVPDTMRDHAYLVLTDADAERAETIKDEQVDSFIDVYALDLSPKAISAGKTGVDALSQRIADHADLGREADADSALLFLRANETALPEPRTSPAPERPPATPEIRVVADAPKERPVSRPRATRVPHAETFSAGLTLLRRFGGEVLREVRKGEPGVEELLPARCTEALQRLSDILQACEDDPSPRVAALIDTVYEAENLVILMETEENSHAACEAVSLMLQVRHDLEACLAA